MIYMIQSGFAILALSILTLFVVCLARALFLRSLQLPPRKLDPVSFDAAEQIQIFARTLTFKTVAKIYPQTFDTEPFIALHEHLKTSFPLCHERLAPKSINGPNLLYTWEGKDKNLPGILLMAHQDVVLIEEGTEKDWSFAPFSGAVSDGYIWGRGALDMKNQLTGILAAAELLLKENFQPSRTVYFAFGCDEEVGGIAGARLISEYLYAKGIRLSMVLDEGGAVVSGMVPGTQKPIALVGIAEKGYMTLTLEAHDAGGHSSMPEKTTSLGSVCRALTRIEQHPFKPAIRGAIKQFLRFLAPELPFAQRLVLANTWLFAPIVLRMLSTSKATNALLRTTQAGTMASASDKENVLPQKAEIKVNFRILPGETPASVRRHVEKAIRDKRVSIIDPPYALEPSSISDPFSLQFNSLHQTIRAFFPDALVAPYLVLGGTDSRYYEKVSENIYRFSPVQLDEKELSGMHGTNERISVAAYIKLIQFYHAVIKDICSG